MQQHQTSPERQREILLKLAHYCVERMGNDLWHLYEAVQMMIYDYGEENWKKEIPDWEERKKKLLRLRSKLSASKVFYDAIQNKKFDKMSNLSEVQKLFHREYIRQAKSIPLLENNLHFIASYYISHSSIQAQTLRSEDLRTIETPSNKLNTEKARALDRGRF